jgi:peptidoglycan/LPS O-acetylase OafA/YrhL
VSGVGVFADARGQAVPAAARVLPEVQALRAVAVAAVVLFHFFPRRIPGGFIGVDVFFVISGFLITGQIVRALERNTFTFRSFYVRRAYRLLPAASLVLGLTAAAALTLLPYSRWRDTMVEVLASLFYVENWVLAVNGSNYFDANPTAAQHYWSLSVEEQFYLLWPAALVTLWWCRRRFLARRSGVLIVGLLTLTGLSLVLSVVMTPPSRSLAYFATYTRMWEFGVGGVLALLPRWQSTPVLRGLIGWAALSVICGSAFMLDEHTAFPGWVALAPVLATAAAIAAGLVDKPWSHAALATSQPVQWLGDISYSVYLWHWPLIVLVPTVSGMQPSAVLKAGLLLTCLVLASLTKVHVEDRFRQHNGSPVSRPFLVRRWSGVTVLVLVTIPACLASFGVHVVHARASAAAAIERRAVADDVACFGAAALATPGCVPPFGSAMVPDPGVAYHQFTQSRARRECLVDVNADVVIRCGFGVASGRTHVALVGDSHALHWLPALEQVAAAADWRITTYLRGSCPANPAVTVRPDPNEQRWCAAWSRDVLGRIVTDDSIDLVVTTASNNKAWVAEDGRTGFETAVAGYMAAWSDMVDAGKTVLVIKDTPRPRTDVLDCLATRPAASCGRDRVEATRVHPDVGADGDPLAVAVDRLGSPRVTLADPVDYICGPSHCQAVVGNVVVYVDTSHLSPTYVRTLVPFLRRHAVAALH